MTTLREIDRHRSFSGWQLRFEHDSDVLKCTVPLSVYLPPAASQRPVPIVYWLSGLTCDDQNFVTKAGAQRVAAELGVAIVCPDTSPRGTDYPGEHERYDLGSGAGFYVDATEEPWSETYQMYSYVTCELVAAVEGLSDADDVPGVVNGNGKRGIFGHSMGGHGALICALRLPNLFSSVSAFAPIANPSSGPWGQLALSTYLGDDRAAWAEWDAVELIRARGCAMPILVDQGLADEFREEQLMPDELRRACVDANVALELREHPGYDHSYYFISSFIEDHLRHHARALT